MGQAMRARFEVIQKVNILEGKTVVESYFKQMLSLNKSIIHPLVVQQEVVYHYP